MRNRFTPTATSKGRETWAVPGIVQATKQPELSLIAGECVERRSSLRKELAVPQKINTALPHDQPGVNPRELKTRVHKRVHEYY